MHTKTADWVLLALKEVMKPKLADIATGALAA